MLVMAHIGGMDCCARAVKAAARMIEENALSSLVDDRYEGWNSRTAGQMLAADSSLEEIAARVEKDDINPQPRSGRQEALENIVNRFV